MGGEQKVPGGRPSRAELQCAQESMGRCWVSLWRFRALYYGFLVLYFGMTEDRCVIPFWCLFWRIDALVYGYLAFPFRMAEDRWGVFGFFS